jgi:hypothetical protein
MHPVFRRILAAIAGVVASVIVIAGVEYLGHSLFLGSTIMSDMNNEAAVRDYAAQLPLGVLISLLVAWTAGTYVGSFVACRIAQTRVHLSAIAVGFFVLLATVMNFLQFPHPMWLMISAFVLIPIASWIAIPRLVKETA